MSVDIEPGFLGSRSYPLEVVRKGFGDKLRWETERRRGCKDGKGVGIPKTHGKTKDRGPSIILPRRTSLV